MLFSEQWDEFNQEHRFDRATHALSMNITRVKRKNFPIAFKDELNYFYSHSTYF